VYWRDPRDEGFLWYSYLSARPIGRQVEDRPAGHRDGGKSHQAAELENRYSTRTDRSEGEVLRGERDTHLEVSKE